MIVRKSIGSGISGAVRYVMGEGKLDPSTGKAPALAPGSRSRVAWYGGTGFGFPIDTDARLDIARRVMEWSAANQASKTKQCREDCLHLMLAWDKDERPSRAEMEEAAHSALGRLGMSGARAIWAVHDDTEHAHLHIVASRINPETGKAFRDGFDTKALSAWALQWEKEHGGVRCEARLANEKPVERDPEKIVTALTLRRETFTERDVNRALTTAIPSGETRRGYVAEVMGRHDIVRLADPETGLASRYTTRQTLAAEHLAEASAGRLQASASHKVSGRALNGVLEGLREYGAELRPDQLRALLHLTKAEGLAVLVGRAGTGKSFTLKTVQDAYAADGCEVKTLAPTNKVASSLKHDGLDAGTIHSTLGNLDRGKTQWSNKTVIMVDEAGMVSTRLMARLLSHAEHVGAKVILVGDDKQLASMERGGMFAHFAAQFGAAELSEILRQRGAEQRDLAARASHYDFAAGLAALETQGALVVAEKTDERVARAAEIWRERTANAPERSLFVMAVSNADAEAANLAVRAIRRERGELGAEHVLQTADGPRAFAPGDRVLFSGSAFARKDRDAGLVNGNSGRITRIDGTEVSVAIDGKKPDETIRLTVGANREAGEFNVLRHGYAGTIYKAQGATYDEAIVLDNGAMRASMAYVALTRHRDAVTVVTARELGHRADDWRVAAGGLNALTPASRENAQRSYDRWRTETQPDAGERHGLADYVAYVQEREAQRRGQDQNGTRDVAAIAARWQRADDRRAASRFEALNYHAAELGVLTPAEVRAAVGVEASAATPAIDPWAWRMPPRPRSIEEERAVLSAFAAPLAVSVQEQSASERDATGLTWWERVGVAAAERWHAAREWVRDSWRDLVASERTRNHDGLDQER